MTATTQRAGIAALGVVIAALVVFAVGGSEDDAPVASVSSVVREQVAEPVVVQITTCQNESTRRFGYALVEGRAHNTSTGTHSVLIDLTLLDASGSVIGQGVQPIRDLLPGHVGIWTKKVIWAGGEGPANCRTNVEVLE